MIGASPILSHFLLVIPPVEVPAAKFPALSKATQPTVPAEPQPAEVTADAGAQPAGQEELV